ncbi:MAG: hypothetical protein K8T90_02950 [Planctomycetes bacterium]|nr:hypothetical protein [Planctomycetota bacterium]
MLDPNHPDTPSGDPQPPGWQGQAVPQSVESTSSPTTLAFPSDGPLTAHDRGAEITLTQRGATITGRRATRTVPLDDPARPGFLELPHVDLDDGRPLRSVATDIWKANLRMRLAAGEVWETTYFPRKPIHTALAIVGAALVGGGALWSLLRWASSDPQIRHQLGLVDGAVLLAAIGLLLWVAYATLSSAARYWVCRHGSYLKVDATGVTISKGARSRAFTDVESVVHHPWLRATEIRLRGGKRLWVPREAGPLVRPDLVLASLNTEPETPRDALR